MKRAAAVILAAGKSRRMGRPKAGLQFFGKSAVELLTQEYLRAGVTPFFVGTHESLPEGAQCIPGQPDGEMIDSLATALPQLPPDYSGAYVQPVDAPFTTAAMVDRLGSPPEPAVLCFEGQRGHPVWLPRKLFESACTRPQGGLRSILDDAQEIDWPGEEILADLDTPSDVAYWQRRCSQWLRT